MLKIFIKIGLGFRPEAKYIQKHYKVHLSFVSTNNSFINHYLKSSATGVEFKPRFPRQMCFSRSKTSIRAEAASLML